MKAWLLDRLGYRMGEVDIPSPPPKVCIWGNWAFLRRPDRDHPGKPHIKCYIQVTVFSIPDTAERIDINEFRRLDEESDLTGSADEGI